MRSPPRSRRMWVAWVGVDDEKNQIKRLCSGGHALAWSVVKWKLLAAVSLVLPGSSRGLPQMICGTDRQAPLPLFG
jgi:hypothetical protein